MSLLMIFVAFASSVVMLTIAAFGGGGVFSIVVAAFLALAGYMLVVARRARRNEIDGHRPTGSSPSIGEVSLGDIRKLALAVGVLSLGFGLFQLVYGPAYNYSARWQWLFTLAEHWFGKRGDAVISLVGGIVLVGAGISPRK